MLADEFCHRGLREQMKQALKTLEEAKESYIVEVIPGSHFRSSNQFLGGFQLVS
jgi:hypothetical protein